MEEGNLSLLYISGQLTKITVRPIYGQISSNNYFQNHNAYNLETLVN